MLLAHLCFPEPNAHHERLRALQVLGSTFLKGAIKDNPSYQWYLQYERPAYFNVYKKDLAWFSRNSKRRLANRLTAANIAITLCTENQVKNLSITKMAEASVPYVSQNEPGNVLSRVWSESRPVLHLAMAIVKGSQTWSPVSERSEIATQMLKNKDLVEFIVKEADAQRQLIETVPRLRGAAAKLIRFRLT